MKRKKNILDLYDPRSVDDRITMDIAMFTKKLVQLQPDTQAIHILAVRQLDQKMCQDHVWLIR